MHPPTDTSTWTDDEILAVVTDFRKGILEDAAPHGECFTVSSPLAGYLSFLTGQSYRCVEGKVGKWFHMWVECPDGRIIDATADQFNSLRRRRRNLPPIYFGPKPEWYK